MTIRDEDIRRQLRLGEDSRWEFKQIEFNGDVPASPRRDGFADEIGAFANAGGGVLLCGVSDDGRLQGMSRDQMTALDRLLVEVSTDAIEPPIRIHAHHRELDERAFALVEVPRGDAVHERSGRAFVRVGASKRHLDADERLRLAQGRAHSRHLWFDKQVVPETGFETLSERLREPLLSLAGAADPRRGLTNLGLLARDEAGVERATVAGVLLCDRSTQRWLPQATIAATHYRGRDGASGQLDAQEIAGPLPSERPNWRPSPRLLRLHGHVDDVAAWVPTGSPDRVSKQRVAVVRMGMHRRRELGTLRPVERRVCWRDR